MPVIVEYRPHGAEQAFSDDATARTSLIPTTEPECRAKAT